MSGHFVIPCWGASYADFCARVTLPSLLSPGNLPFLARHSPMSMHFYVDSDAEKVLNAHPSMARLRQLMHVELILVQDVVQAPMASKYQQMIACHQHFFRTYGRAGNALYFSNADYLWSDGALARTYEAFVAGKRLVSTGILRLNRHALLSVLQQPEFAGPVLSLAPRTLVRIGLQHLHPEMLASFYNGATLTAWASILLWNVPHEGLIMRTFHHQCVAARPSVNVGELQGTIDCNVTACLGIKPQDVEMISDSDEMCYFEATDPIDRTELLFTPQNFEQEVAAWIANHALEVHRLNASVPFRYHWAACTKSAWDQVEHQSAELVARLVQRAREFPAPPSDTLLGPARLW